MRKATFFFAVALLIATLVPMGVQAQSADAQTWSTSITYYTPDATGGKLQIRYYAEGSSTSIDAAPITLAGHTAGSLFIGNVSGMPATFAGGAVLEADVPIVATAVNIASGEYPRPLYSGFDPSLASEDFFIPTVLYQKFNSNTLVSIQNVETTDINATLKVYALGSTTPAFQQTYPVKAQSAKLVPAADMGLAAGFTGSAVVDATGKVVAAAQENDINGRSAKAFEGLPADAGATTIYMASMMCQAFGGQTSYYAIQNVDTSATAANVEIDFYDTSGAKVYTATGISIGNGGKASENPCKYTSSAPALQGVSGSAVIRSTNGIKLIAMGKVSSPSMTATAFVGQSQGAMKSAAPYIRWKVDPAAGERAYVAVMNVGTGDATNVTATYYDNQGNAAATATLASGGNPLAKYIKVNTNWQTASGSNTDFGTPPPGYGGAIEIQSDQPVIVVVRVSKKVAYGGITSFAEDYNGVPVP